MTGPRTTAGLVHAYAGLRYRTHPEVYDPADDSWLLVDAVRAQGDLSGQRVLEVGCGAGLALLAAVRQGAQGVGVDRNPTALRLLAENARLNGFARRVAALRGDMVSALDPGALDLIAFNPPYLPTAEDERVGGELGHAFDGGASGNDAILRFLTSLEAWSARGRRPPVVLLLTSSLNDREEIHSRLAALGLGRVKHLGERRFLFERLHVERFSGA